MKKLGVHILITVFIFSLILGLIYGLFIYPRMEYNKVAKNICTSDCGKKLQKAKKITIIKKLYTNKKEFLVVSNGEVVATLKGKAFPILGDVYSVYDGQGEKPVLIEKGRNNFRSKYGKITLGNVGVIHTPDGKQLETVKEDRFSWGSSIHLRNNHDKDIAYLREINFHIMKQYQIMDKNNKEMFHLTEKFIPLQKEYRLDVKNHEIDINKILILAAAADE